MTDNLFDKINIASLPELKAIASEIRQKTIEVVSKTGGHLAPSLGVVELSVALHHVFESPKDSIVWDVGHQAYAHKLITGRSDVFDTLRQKDGISGFPRRVESEHDQFGTGHSSTSISAALGIAEAKRIAGEAGFTIAVIGDGAMTAGLAYEGLNHAGHVLNKRLIVILNDNQMSIDRNVGALANFMNKGLTHPVYNRVRRDLRTLLRLFSIKDINLLELSRRAALVVKDFFLAGSLFEAFGFRYIGPVDGHDIEKLVQTLKNVTGDINQDEEKTHPILLHVITQKGKGYAPAERDPERFHGISAFNLEDGSSKRTSAKPTYTSVFGKTLCGLMSKDSRIVAITAAMPSGTGMNYARDQFPGRYYDVGIAEPHAVVFAAGLATRGLKPVVAIYSSFLQRSYDQIIHDVCLQDLPVIFAIDRAGVVGEDGPTHHGVFDLSYLRHIPNLIVMSPKDENELRHMLFSAIAYNKPVAIRYPRGDARGVPIDKELGILPVGKAEVISDSEKSTRAIFAVGNMVRVAEEIAEILSLNGITASVINVRFVKPLDEEMIFAYAQRACSFVTIEDNVAAGGFGSALLEFVNSRKLQCEVLCFGYPDKFVEHAKVTELHEMYGLVAKTIASQILQKTDPSSDATGVLESISLQ